MAAAVGWKQETQIPPGASGYDAVPRFRMMLEEFGDWLGFLMNEIIISHGGWPADYFVIHPDQAGSSAVSASLRERQGGKLTVVKVDSEHLDYAKQNQLDWKVVLSQIGVDHDWVKQLESLRDTKSQAIITDEFNASGDTYAVLQSLLEYFGIRTRCYFPLVDRDRRSHTNRYRHARYCLYRLHGSRADFSQGSDES